MYKRNLQQQAEKIIVYKYPCRNCRNIVATLVKLVQLSVSYIGSLSEVGSSRGDGQVLGNDRSKSQLQALI